MRFVVIRNQKSDKFTMHRASCSVAVKHYGLQVSSISVATQEEALADVAELDSTIKVKICECCKETE